MMSVGKKEYTFEWLIENYSYCWHKNEERLDSPQFRTEGLDCTAWHLRLYPRGDENKSQGWISLFLNRNKDDAGPQNVLLDFELSFLAIDGSSLFTKIAQNTFKMDGGWGWGGYRNVDEVVSSRKADYLPQDTLRVRCKMWKGEGEVQPQAEIKARTRIGIEQISFLHLTENFSTRKFNHKETEKVQFPSNQGLDLSCSLCFPNELSVDAKIMVEITPSESKYILTICRLFLIDGSGKKIQCAEIDNRLEATRNDIGKFPLSLSWLDILNRKNEYLPNDKLSLSCECCFSSGIELEKIENTVYKKHFKVVNHVSNKKTDNIFAKQLSTCPSVVDDLKAIYNDQFLTDVELKTKTKSFPAHKNVLCSRSSVFKMMLTNDMKEKITDCIEIDDLEDDILQQFLLFLYSDVLENLEWDSAIKLYYAGDKYTVEKLKLTCSSFLVQNLSTSNAGELLLLADKHSDSNLKKTVQDFILSHEEAVFSSEEWRNLIKTNSVLVSETMCLKYMRK